MDKKELHKIFFSGRHYTAKLTLIDGEIILINQKLDFHLIIPDKIRNKIEYLEIYDGKTNE